MTVAHVNGKANGAAPVRPRRAAPPPEPAKADATGSATIAIAFAEIGHVVRTMSPAKASASALAALEYYGSSVVAQLAEAWRGRAKKQALALGVLPNYEAEPYPIGTAETVYAGTLVTIGLQVVRQADRVDVPGLVADLEKSGVKRTVLRRLLKKHTKTFAGAHIFTASLAA